MSTSANNMAKDDGDRNADVLFFVCHSCKCHIPGEYTVNLIREIEDVFICRWGAALLVPPPMLTEHCSVTRREKFSFKYHVKFIF
jgi:hypothetical protein